MRQPHRNILYHRHTVGILFFFYYQYPLYYYILIPFIIVRTTCIGCSVVPWSYCVVTGQRIPLHARHWVGLRECAMLATENDNNKKHADEIMMMNNNAATIMHVV